jgi:hypothetical protein
LQKAGTNIAGKTKFVTGKKKFKRESFVYQNKSMKHKKCLLNIVLISKTEHLRSIHGIINYVQINTYWSCIAGFDINGCPIARCK